MITTDRGRGRGGRWVALAAIGLVGLPGLAISQTTRTAPRKNQGQFQQDQTPPPASDKTRLDKEVPRFEEKAIPVNPSDPIAFVNGETITRHELADETVARKGKEVLETMIRRRLVEQALKERKLEVSPAEIDMEIDQIAQRMAGLGREAWLRTLDKERGISPIQYARDIIFPSIALRKLAISRVQVTDKDMKEAMDANFGPKLYCRIITVEKMKTATEIWNQLKKNPNSFERLALERSTDEATKPLGGMLTTPISRHGEPRNVTDRAFQQLVDTDPNDPESKPKDGDISAAIQVNDVAWIILKRERVTPAQEYDPKDPKVRQAIYAQLFEVKLDEAMKIVLEELVRGSEVDNRLAGTFKPKEEFASDRDVKLMSGGGTTGLTNPSGAKTSGGRSVGKTMPAGAGGAPVGLPADATDQADRLRQAVSKPR